MTLLRSATALLAAAALTLGLGACGDDEDEWHPVTTDESQALAITRFNNFNEGTRSLAASITVEGQQLDLLGWYDFVEHVGYVSVTGVGFEPQALLWDGIAVALHPSGSAPGLDPALPAAPATDPAWVVRALDPSSSGLDALLASVTELGSDRPDNPLLMQQSGALWLGTEEIEVNGETIDAVLFTTPVSNEPLGPDDPMPTPETALVRLALDKRSLLHRAELNLGGTWRTVDFWESPQESLADAHAVLNDLVEGVEAE